MILSRKEFMASCLTLIGATVVAGAVPIDRTAQMAAAHYDALFRYAIYEEKYAIWGPKMLKFIPNWRDEGHLWLKQNSHDLFRHEEITNAPGGEGGTRTGVHSPCPGFSAQTPDVAGSNPAPAPNLNEVNIGETAWRKHRT